MLKAFDDKSIVEYRNSGEGINPFSSLDDLPLTDEQKTIILQWFAWKCTDIMVECTRQTPNAKSYDPLLFEDTRNAVSYAFNFKDGGRHHTFNTLTEVEIGLVKETADWCKINNWMDDPDFYPETK